MAARVRVNSWKRPSSFIAPTLVTGKKNDYLPKAIASVIEGSVGVMETRMSRLLFKYAVGLSMMMILIAAGFDVNESDLTKLRRKCMEEVKRSNRKIAFDEVLQYQRGK